MTTHIVYVFDKNYAQYSCVSAISAFYHSKENIVFHIITSKDDNDAEEIFVDELKAHNQIVKTYSVDLNLGYKTFRGIQTSCYLKLFIPELIQEKKVLYVDGDTIFHRCPSEVFSINIDNQFVAAVCDFSHFPSMRNNWPTKIPFEKNNELYFNSGMILWNLAQFKSFDLLKTSRSIYEQYSDVMKFNDQDLLNKAFEGQKKIIDYRFNFQIFNGYIKKNHWEKISSRDSKQVSLFHFIGKHKPWKKFSNPLIVNYWSQFSSELKTINLIPEPAKNFQQRKHYAKMLHINERYEEASDLRGELLGIAAQRFSGLERKISKLENNN